MTRPVVVPTVSVEAMDSQEPLFGEIVVGVDGRQGGRDALALAARLASPDASITLVHVYGAPVMAGRAGAIGLPLALEASERLLAHARLESELSAAVKPVCDSSVGRGLHAAAEGLSADLLVVGSCHRAPLGRALAGNDSASALDGAPCATAAAPHGYAHEWRRLAKIGVGYDGSPESERAVEVARELARPIDARVKVLWVVTLEDVRDEGPTAAKWSQAADELVERHTDQLGRIEGIEGASVYGAPREELSWLSDRVDLLIVGSRGYGPLRRLFHGSVSRYLLSHVSCPLLVLPRLATADVPSARATRVRALR